MAQIISNSTIDEWVIEKRLSGGHSLVFSGHHKDLKDWMVVIKIVCFKQQGSNAFRDDLKREALSLFSLKHDRIPRVFAFRIDEQRHYAYLVTELVQGIDLYKAQIDLERSFSIQETLGILRQIGSALDHAHSIHILHRDIKRRNIVLKLNEALNRNNGGFIARRNILEKQAYLVDFGYSTAPWFNAETFIPFITNSEFIAPEVARGKRSTVRADNYSLAALTFWCLTSRLPYEARNLITRINMIAHPDVEPKSILEFLPKMPSSLDDVFKKALHNDPSKRYATAAAFIKDVASIG